MSLTCKHVAWLAVLLCAHFHARPLETRPHALDLSQFYYNMHIIPLKVQSHTPYIYLDSDQTTSWPSLQIGKGSLFPPKI